MTLNKKWIDVETMMVRFAVMATQAGDSISHKVVTSPALTVRKQTGDEGDEEARIRRRGIGEKRYTIKLDLSQFVVFSITYEQRLTVFIIPHPPWAVECCCVSGTISVAFFRSSKCRNVSYSVG